MTIAGLVVTGMGVATLGSVKVHLAARLRIDEARVGGLISLFGFTVIPVILTAGFLTDRFGLKQVLVGGSLVMAAGMVLLARATTYRAALIAVFVFTAGWAALVDVLNVLNPLAFPGNMAYATNLGISFTGLGAFITPLSAVFLLRRFGYTSSLLLLSALVLVPAILSIRAEIPHPTATAEIIENGGGTESSTAANPSGLQTLLGDPILWVCGLIFFCYSPLEAAVVGWATTYLGAKGINQALAAALLSCFWLGALAMQVMTALTLPAGFEARLLLWLSILSVLMMCGIVWSRSRTAAVLLVIGAGLSFGPIMPTTVAVLLNHFDPSVHGRAIGLFFAIGGVGWTTIPLAIGALSRRTTIQHGFLVAVAAASGLVAMTTTLVFLTLHG